MSLEINLEILSLQTTLILIREGKKSGVLTIENAGEQRQFIFRFGEMIHARSSTDLESMLGFFISQGIISTDNIPEFDETETITLSQIVQNLPTTKKVEIIAAMQARAKIILYQTMYWERGTITFLERETGMRDSPEIQKEMDEVENLADQDLDRLIRLKQILPFKEMVYSLDPARMDSMGAGLTLRESQILFSMDGEKTVAEILNNLEGEELFNIFTILEILEVGTFQRSLKLKLAKPMPAWEQKIIDFIKVYDGVLKKIRSLSQGASGKEDLFYLRTAFQEASKENTYLWKVAQLGPQGQFSLEMLAQRVQFLPVKHQLRLFKNSVNTYLLWQLIAIKNNLGYKHHAQITEELQAILSVLQSKGNINHKEIANEIPLIFDIVKEFPTWIDQGILLFQLKFFEEAAAMFQRVPATHPEQKKTKLFLTRIKKERILSDGLDKVLIQIYKALSDNNVMIAKQLLAALKEDCPTHEEIEHIEKQIEEKIALTERRYHELSVKPVLRPDFDFSRIDQYKLSQEEGFFLSRIDGSTSIKDLCAIGGGGRHETILHLDRLVNLGIAQMPDGYFEKVKPADIEEYPTEKVPPIPVHAEKYLDEETEKIVTIQPVIEEVREKTKVLHSDFQETTRWTRKEIEQHQKDVLKTIKTKKITPQDHVKQQQNVAVEKKEPTRKEKADVFFSAGLKAMREKNFQEAIGNFEKAIENFSAGVAYYQYLDQARSQFKEQKVEQIIAETKEKYREGNVQEAAKMLREAINLSPRNRDLLVMATDIWSKLQNPSRAKQALASLIEMEPGNPEHYVNLGKIYAAEGDLVKARNQYKTALQWNNRHGEAIRQLKLLP